MPSHTATQQQQLDHHLDFCVVVQSYTDKKFFKYMRF